MSTTERRPLTRALLSVFDKTGIVDLARTLAENGVEIVSTGSTGSTIRDAGIAVTDVEKVTGFPEMLDGRVKTLHPRIHGGILADQRLAAHQEQLKAHQIDAFDLVVVNLYPFSETVAAGGSFEEIIEKIDVGGPTMVRAAAKNFASLAVVVDPEGYSIAAEAVAAGGFTLEERQQLATIAFTRTAEYDDAISDWMLEQLDGPAEAEAEEHADAAPAEDTDEDGA
ncbi:MAG: bifunctional phosphoribosylaminoimidazolecarboxamide formyltransferase/IMP cyclohydrolase, partial [Brachybacterium sp.]|nr:bifunctional phosphoribosylaminoimidazolecarboxamide formyltransferase/IMP cyclohydrolase [Brachybacterium sp.]